MSVNTITNDFLYLLLDMLSNCAQQTPQCKCLKMCLLLKPTYLSRKVYMMICTGSNHKNKNKAVDREQKIATLKQSLRNFGIFCPCYKVQIGLTC